MLMTALLANTAVNSANTTGNGLFFGEFTLFKVHLIALGIVIVYTFVGSMIILKVTDLLSSLTVSAEEKKVGSDMAQHGENLFPFDLSTANES